VKSTDTTKLFVALSELPNYNVKLPSFPVVAAIAPQSSGKSSAVDAISGFNLLPKFVGMATCKPTYVTLIRSPQVKFTVGGKDFYTEKDAADEIARLNKNPQSDKLNIVVHSPNVYNCVILDLPGLVAVADDKGLPEKLKKTSAEYMADPNIIPMIVHAAPSDPATSQAIKMSQKFTREADSIFVITKCDMVAQQKTGMIEQMLRGEKYSKGMGAVAVVLRSDKDLDAGVTIEEQAKRETEFFKKYPSLKPCGLNSLRQLVSNTQYQRIKGIIPKLIGDIDGQIAALQISDTFLGNLVNNDQPKLAGQLHMMVEKLVPSALERAQFERHLKCEFKKAIEEYMIAAIQPDKQEFETILSAKYIDSNVRGYNLNHCTKPGMYKVDELREFFSYGQVSPIEMNNETLTASFNKELHLAMALAMFDPVIEDPLGEKRLRWSKFLNRFFASLLSNDNIHNLVYQITEKMLVTYICEDNNDQLAKQFADYMVKEIGGDAYTSHIKFSITALINIEKRPHISMIELVRHLTQLYLEYFTYKDGFFETFRKDKHRLKLEIYGPAWNLAYLKETTDQLSENCYRNVAVNLLDPMVRKLIEMTLDMFNKENAIKEQKKVNGKINKLRELREVIQSYTVSNCDVV
jgi:hypothetical protein